MIFTIRDQTWIYLHPAKTGGTTIRKILAQIADTHLYHHTMDTWGCHPHALLFPERVRGAKILLSVRNPFDRALSYHRHLNRHGFQLPSPDEIHSGIGDFAPALFSRQLRTSGSPLLRAKMSQMLPEGRAPDHLIRFETLDRDLRTFLKLLDRRFAGKIPHENRSPRPLDYTLAYTPDDLIFAHAAFLVDCAQFDYAWPRLAGDQIARITAALNLPHCAECESRRQAFNRLHARARGWLARHFPGVRN